MISLIKYAEELEKNKEFKKVDSITKYLVELANTKKLKAIEGIDSDIPFKLLCLEKAGVDTSEFFNKIHDNKLSKEDIETIEEKFEQNCPDKKIESKDTDFHEYILWMNKETTDSPQNKDESIKYLDKIRESFIDFLVDVVMKDFKKDCPNEESSPDNVLDYYFSKREDYENQLDTYDLMLGQTEGIMSDENFKEDFDEEIVDDPGPEIRRAK